MVRTMENILGIPPMNQFDLMAEPMLDCFTESPDFTPYKAEKNNIPLDEINPPLESLNGKKRYWAKSQWNRIWITTIALTKIRLTESSGMPWKDMTALIPSCQKNNIHKNEENILPVFNGCTFIGAAFCTINWGYSCSCWKQKSGYGCERCGKKHNYRNSYRPQRFFLAWNKKYGKLCCSGFMRWVRDAGNRSWNMGNGRQTWNSTSPRFHSVEQKHRGFSIKKRAGFVWNARCCLGFNRSGTEKQRFPLYGWSVDWRCRGLDAENQPRRRIALRARFYRKPNAAVNRRNPAEQCHFPVWPQPVFQYYRCVFGWPRGSHPRERFGALWQRCHWRRDKYNFGRRNIFRESPACRAGES